MKVMRCKNCGFEIKIIDPLLHVNCKKNQDQDCDFEVIETDNATGAVSITRYGKPGTQLRTLINELKLTDRIGCGCAAFARKMDKWGVPGCKTNYGLIVQKLNEAAIKATWIEKLRVGAHGYFTVESLIDEAIRRAEEIEEDNEKATA